jgi:DNA repair exonuclease SbcCD ATPase subunit
LIHDLLFKKVALSSRKYLLLLTEFIAGYTEMTSRANETVLEDKRELLQLKRPLLSIDRYAAREGISRLAVEEYGRLGIVQLRKYKGEIYVVDVPLSPYHPVAEELEILQESPPAQSVRRAGHTAESQTAEDYSQPVNKTSRVRKIAELAKGATNDTRKIADGAKRQNTESLRTETKPASAETIRAGRSGLGNDASRAVQGLISKASHIASKLTRTNGASHAAHSNEFNPYESAPTSTPDSVPQADQRQSDMDAELTDLKQNRQIAVVFLVVCLFGAFIACLWLYMNQKVHHGRIDRAYASIQNVYDDFVQSSQQLSTLQSKLVESTAEIEWIKNEVNISKQQEASVRKELGQLRTSIETIQQNNTAALEQLKEQFQQLTAQLGKFIKNRQTFSDSSVPDK